MTTLTYKLLPVTVIFDTIGEGMPLDGENVVVVVLSVLATKLLAYGGTKVVIPYLEPDILELFKRGTIVQMNKLRIIKGYRNSCHSNSAKYSLKHPGTTMYTGYALSDDDMWRQHSWVVDTKGIIETTEKRIAYFGIPYTIEQAQQLAQQ
jgi:hypothetical protein